MFGASSELAGVMEFGFNITKVKTDKQEGDVRCRMCKDREETVAHLASECSKLAQPIRRDNDKVARIVHWSLREK